MGLHVLQTLLLDVNRELRTTYGKSHGSRAVSTRVVLQRAEANLVLALQFSAEPILRATAFQRGCAVDVEDIIHREAVVRLGREGECYLGSTREPVARELDGLHLDTTEVGSDADGNLATAYRGEQFVVVVGVELAANDNLLGKIFPVNGTLEINDHGVGRRGKQVNLVVDCVLTRCKLCDSCVVDRFELLLLGKGGIGRGHLLQGQRRERDGRRSHVADIEFGYRAVQGHRSSDVVRGRNRGGTGHQQRCGRHGTLDERDGYQLTEVVNRRACLSRAVIDGERRQVKGR